MFTLTDGREYLFQWDVNRQVKVSDPTVTEVHFCNRTSDCSLVVEVTDGLANIPNLLLQDNRPIRVYAYCDCYTKVEKVFEVKARTKPSDYAYTETEIKSYEYLEKKLTEIEDKGFSEETVAIAVDNHFEKNPIQLVFNDDGEGNVTMSVESIPDAEEVYY